MTRIKLFVSGIFICGLLLFDSVVALTCLKGGSVTALGKSSDEPVDVQLCPSHYFEASCLRVEFVGRLQGSLAVVSGICLF